MAVAASRFVVLTCYIEPDTEVGGFVSRCPALGVASQGETLKEAEANIRPFFDAHVALHHERLI